MRLLRHGKDDELELVDFRDGVVPPYAILSHTWGTDEDEVTFSDLMKDTGRTKSGYYKLRACGGQARQDKIQYFWVDTCCINKEDKAELSLAIQSMFIWYKNASKCYAYLSDISTKKRKFDSTADCGFNESAFRASRWFTRGWTLQELLAPTTVEFFSSEWDRLGDKTSLQTLIQEITGISYKALGGVPLSQFSVDERLQWKGDRKTGREEDAWYSLSGILDVQIAPAYSEGAASAFKRLMDEVKKLKECLRDLRNTDPRDDKKRIEETKGGLFVDSYRWILDNSTFQQWKIDQNNQLLWIKGNPGKGKTMLLCGIINELHSSKSNTTHLAYFFCQATDSRINSATAVIRGLLYMLVSQQPSLASHVRKKYDEAGRVLFEDANAWVALTEIFRNILQDPTLENTYLVVDALDECITALPNLLNSIATWSSASCRVKWIVSSRNEPRIEEHLERAGGKIRLSLELNADHVSTAVNYFIQWKVLQLVEQKRYDSQLRDAVLSHLTSNAKDTFLWVALVCQSLEHTAKRNVLRKLKSFPPGLKELYQQMMQYISDSDDAKICKQILALNAVVYRPLALSELMVFAEPYGCVENIAELREIIGLCGSFLTIRENIIYFVHQSAQDYLSEQASHDICPEGITATHRLICCQSISLLSEKLHRDMYSLKKPGFPINNVTLPNPDPLETSRYSCSYWMDHLCSSKPDFGADGDLQLTKLVSEFMKKKYLYWLEGLSLCKSVARGINSINKLSSIVQDSQNNDNDEFSKRVHDARRFIMYHKEAIQNYPLQTYASALLFSPSESVTRKSFCHEEPTSITVWPKMKDRWDARLQVLEHENCVKATVSPDSSLIASLSKSEIRLWDANDGECLQLVDLYALSGAGYHWDAALAFSNDSKRLGLTSSDTILIFDVVYGGYLCLSAYRKHDVPLHAPVFSQNLKFLAAPVSPRDKKLNIWDAASGERISIISTPNQDDKAIVTSYAFLHESTKIVVGFQHESVIWDFHGNHHVRTIDLSGINTKPLITLVLSCDSELLACAFESGKVAIIDVSSGEFVQEIDGNVDAIGPLSFSYDSKWFVRGSGRVDIWDLTIGLRVRQFDRDDVFHHSVIFYRDSTKLLSATFKGLTIWENSGGETMGIIDPDYMDTIAFVMFSPDSTLLAMSSFDCKIKIWDTNSKNCLNTIESVSNQIGMVAFSHDSTRLAFAAENNTIEVWELVSSTCLLSLKGHVDTVTSVTFSHDSNLLASSSEDRMVKLWNVENGKCLSTFEGHERDVKFVTFPTNDSTRIASLSLDRTVRIWDTRSLECVQIIDEHGTFLDEPYCLAFSRDRTKLVSMSYNWSYNRIRLWNLRISECVSDFEVDRLFSKVSFDISGRYLNSNIGPVLIPTSLNKDECAVSLSSLVLDRHHIRLSTDKKWITYDSENVLWMPLEYRAFHTDASERSIAIADRNEFFVVNCTSSNLE